MSTGLNAGQQIAADTVLDFMFSDEKEMIISGPGGTGKTYIMGVIDDEILPAYEDTCGVLGIKPEFSEVHMTATTNPAANALGEATGKPTSTIFSFLGLTVVNDWKTGKSLLRRTNKWQVHENKLLIVDEAYTLNTPALNYLHDGTLNCKIIYVGDHCQLGPVGEAYSPISKLGCRMVRLDEQMRTTVPELQALNQQLRNTVETGVFNPIHEIPGIIDFMSEDEMLDEIDRKFTTANLDDRIFAYTNDQVITYNDHIRTLRNLPNEFQVGESLVNTEAIKVGGNKGTMLSVEETVTILSLEPPEDFTVYSTSRADPDIHLKVQRATLVNKRGVFYNHGLIPVDYNHFVSLKNYFAKRKNWPAFYTLKENILDLRPRDAATIHKGQGSSVNTSYIDVGDLSSCKNPDTAARLLYVGGSRARERVVLFGDLASKFGGMIYA